MFEIDRDGIRRRAVLDAYPRVEAQAGGRVVLTAQSEWPVLRSGCSMTLDEVGEAEPHTIEQDAGTKR